MLTSVSSLLCIGIIIAVSVASGDAKTTDRGVHVDDAATIVYLDDGYDKAKCLDGTCLLQSAFPERRLHSFLHDRVTRGLLHSKKQIKQYVGLHA